MRSISCIYNILYRQNAKRPNILKIVENGKAEFGNGLRSLHNSVDINMGIIDKIFKLSHFDLYFCWNWCIVYEYLHPLSICVVMLCPPQSRFFCIVYLGGQSYDKEKVQLFRIPFSCSSQCSHAARCLGIGDGFRNCSVSVFEGSSYFSDGFCFDRQSLDRCLVTDNLDSSDSFVSLSALPFLFACLSDRFCRSLDSRVFRLCSCTI